MAAPSLARTQVQHPDPTGARLELIRKALQVHDYIANEACLEYIRKSAPVCVADGKCFPHGTDAVNGCVSRSLWQWQDLSNPEGAYSYHAPGVNPYPIHRKTHAGADTNP